MDYAHPLRFGLLLRGTFAASGDDAARAVELARRAECLGLDLVAVDGRATSEGEVDPWTLLTWLAATTDRITLAACDLALPDVPAVLARAAASLDLLSDGRLELGISAEDRPALEAPAALAEAVQIVRDVWSGSSAPLDVRGEVFSASRAQRGPAPAHTIPIWVGAPRHVGSGESGSGARDALGVVSELADGWHRVLGSADGLTLTAAMSDSALENLVRSGAELDAAARAAGRDPREVRRSLAIPAPVLPPAEHAALLVRLALEAGISTFLLEPADDDALGAFAQDVAPAVRAEVNSARRARGAVVGVPLPARLSRLRRAGIDYDAVPASVPSIEPWHAQFAGLRSNYLRGGNPGLVLLPRDASEVGEAIRFAAAQDVPLGVRSGGHGISGRSTNDGGVVIDLSRLDGVELLGPSGRLVRVGAGARWGDVAAALAPHGLAITSGDSGGVGVGGLATAGGIGWYSRQYGLTIDRVRAVDVVLADGSAARASATENPDLFWAMRGAGGNAAIATSFEIEAHPGGPLGFAQLVFDASDTAGFLEAWGALVEASPRDVTSFLLMGRPRPGQPVIAQVMTAVDSSNPETVIERLNPFAQLAPLLDQTVQIVPYGSIVAPSPRQHRGEGEPVARSSLVEHISREVALAAERVVTSGAAFFFQVRAVGGAVADVAPEATAYAHRGANFSVIGMGASRTRLDSAWDELHRHALGLYLSFDTDPRPERLTDAFPPATLARLRVVKDRYDHDGVLRDNFAIGTSDGSGGSL